MGVKKEGVGEKYSVRISENALLNIDEITDYIAREKNAPLTAIKVGEQIFSTIHLIAKRPFSFKECDHLKKTLKIYRQARCMSWYIVYRVKDSTITILGIMHTSRKPGLIKRLKKIE